QPGRGVEEALARAEDGADDRARQVAHAEDEAEANEPHAIGRDEIEPRGVRRGDPLFEAQVEHAPQERRAMDRLEDEYAPAPAAQLRDVEHGPLERRAT